MEVNGKEVPELHYSSTVVQGSRSILKIRKKSLWQPMWIMAPEQADEKWLRKAFSHSLRKFEGNVDVKK